MNKFTRTISAVSIVIFILTLKWCGTTTTINEAIIEQTAVETFTVKWESSKKLDLYGTIKLKSTETIQTTRAWRLTELSCQVWESVKKWDIIWVISPDTSSPQYQSYLIQNSSLQEQLNNMLTIQNSTQASFDIQIQQLELQKENSNNQLWSLEKNLKNLKTQQTLNQSDLDDQVSNLQNQVSNIEKSLEILEESKTTQLSTIQNNINNIHEQIFRYAIDSTTALDKIFGVSPKYANLNDNYEFYLWKKNSWLLTEVEGLIRGQYLIIENQELYSWDTLSELLTLLSENTLKAAESINSSISSANFPQSTIEDMYKSTNKMADGYLQFKGQYDQAFWSFKNTQLQFDTQITNLQTQVENIQYNYSSLSNNKKTTSELTYENQVTNLQTQVDAAKNALQNAESQIIWLRETQKSQLTQLDNQIATIQQNISLQSNNIQSENLTATMNWIIKQKLAENNNMIWANSAVCMIAPLSNDGYKLEIYSPEIIPLETEFSYSLDWINLWTDYIEFESPSTNLQTQNYIYETSIQWDIKEWSRLQIQLYIENPNGKIRIPINYIIPQLEAYYVKKLVNWEIKLEAVRVSSMNNWSIEILEWLNIWDEIIR